MTCAVRRRSLLRAALCCLLASLALVSVNSFSPAKIPLRSSTHALPNLKPHYDRSIMSMSATSPSRGRWWTRLGAGSTTVEAPPTNKNRVLVKERPKVRLDRETGKLTEISPAPTDKKSNNPWKLVKRAAYSTADAVTSLPSKLARNKNAPMRTVDGYSATIEKPVLKTTSSASPGERLMKEYQVRALETDKEPAKNLFDEIKNGLYSTVDGVSNMVKKDTTSTSTLKQETFKPVVQPTLAASSQVKDALPDLKSKSPGKRWLAEFKIRNWEEQHRRKQRQLEREEAAQNFKEAAYQMGDALVFLLESLAQLPDKINEAAIVTKAATMATMQWFQSLPGMVDTTVQTIAAIPTRVNEQVTQVQTTVESSIETTKKAVEEVQAMPTKIQKSVETTKKNVDDTITNVKVLVGVEKKVPAPPKTPPPKPLSNEELAGKVAWGLVTFTAKTAWWVTVGVAKLSFAGAKLAYAQVTENLADERMLVEPEVSVTTIVEIPEPQVATPPAKPKMATPPSPVAASKPQTTTSQPKAAFATEQVVEKKEAPKKADATPKKPNQSPFSKMGFFGSKKTQAVEDKEVSATQLAAKDELLSIEMEALDKEVSEALKLADQALMMADEGRGKKGGKSDLDEALRRAREAALLATQEAVEIERSMRP